LLSSDRKGWVLENGESIIQLEPTLSDSVQTKSKSSGIIKSGDGEIVWAIITDQEGPGANLYFRKIQLSSEVTGLTLAAPFTVASIIMIWLVFWVSIGVGGLLERTERQIRLLRVQSEELVLARDEASAAAQAKSYFLANMSHEIRTPISGVMGIARIGLRDSPTIRSGEQFEQILTSSEHLLSIINDILDFSKIEASKLEIESRPFQPLPVIETTINLLRQKAASKGISLNLKFEMEMPNWVQGDSHRLQQILLNLLSNAIKFTPMAV
jgi:signal transduction histidine kinase